MTGEGEYRDTMTYYANMADMDNEWRTANIGTACEPLTYPDKVQWDINNNKKGDENMHYLYEVILVNPKNDDFYIDRVVKRSEISALMAIYAESNFIQPPNTVPFDDLKTSCRVLMEWKKEKSLKKAIETIKEAVE